MKTIKDLTPEELKIYKDFIYLVHFKSFLDLYGIDTIRNFSLEIFHSACFLNENKESEIPDFIKSLYFIARAIDSSLKEPEEITEAALEYIKANREPDKYSLIKMHEYLSNVN